jgi:hypothetical protein
MQTVLHRALHKKKSLIAQAFSDLLRKYTKRGSEEGKG